MEQPALEAAQPRDPGTAKIGRERQALDELFDDLYVDLKKVARAQLRRWRPGQSMNTTALVHEAWFKFERQKSLQASDLEHFYAIAARAMRQVLVDFARKRTRLKRGANEEPVAIESGHLEDPLDFEQVIVIDQALHKLEQHSERLARVVELRFLVGLTEKEIAQLSGVTTRTVRNEWARARVWLREAMKAAPQAP